MRSRNPRNGVAWLEVAVVLAILALLLQVFPSLCSILLRTVDVRRWSRGVWFVANVAFVVTLIGIRYWPGIAVAWQARQTRLNIERERQRRLQERKEQRELLARIHEARKRRNI